MVEQTYEDDFEFLDREDFDEGAFDDETIFRSQVDRIFTRNGKSLITDKQSEAMFDRMSVRGSRAFASGIKPIEINFRTGSQTRFSLAGQRGLFGLGKAIAFFKGLK